MIDLDDPSARSEFVQTALALLRPDLEMSRIDMMAFSELAAGTLTGDRAVRFWTERWRLHLLEQRLRSAGDG